MYQPKTGARCTCRRGLQRDNCPACEGTGWQIDFRAIHARAAANAADETRQAKARAEQKEADETAQRCNCEN